MKRKILVLDAFTNGHEAALLFIQKRRWIDGDCELIFCGSHSRILLRLTREPAYAVVPVHNSIAGEISEVTNQLRQIQLAGNLLTEEDRLDLAITHCLLTSHDIKSADSLKKVISHEKAFEQCSTYLDSIGITKDKRQKTTSTGHAAKIVAELGENSKIGAISPKAAASGYGLKVLAESIQNTADNTTTFVLLQATQDT